MRIALAFALAAITLTPSVAFADGLQNCLHAADQGQVERRERRLVSAREQFIACASASCPAVVRADCARWLDDLDAILPTIAVRATSPAGDDVSASVEIDGLRVDLPSGGALRVDPGSHVVVVKADGYQRAERRLLVMEGERGRVLSVPLAPVAATSPAPPPLLSLTETERRGDGLKAPSPLVYALGGVGLLSLGSFTYFGLSGKSAASQLRSGCNVDAMCTQSQIDDVRTKYVVADVSLAIGVVSLGVAAFLWWQNSR